jgi:hypothetical protein
MRFGDLTLEVVAFGEPLPIVAHGGKTYLVARSGASYHVTVRRGGDDSYNESVKVRTCPSSSLPLCWPRPPGLVVWWR